MYGTDGLGAGHIVVGPNLPNECDASEAQALDPTDPTRAGKLQELQQGESFLEYLVELRAEYGVSNFF